MEEKEFADGNNLPDDFDEIDPNFDLKLGTILSVDNIEEDNLTALELKLHKALCQNFDAQMKIKRSILGKLFPSLITNERFIKRLAKLIVTTNRWKDFLYQYIPGQIESRLLIPTMAMVVFLVGIGVVTYYSFYNGNKNTSPIANNPNPISTSKPIISTPSPIPTVSPTPNVIENTQISNKVEANDNKPINIINHKKQNETLFVTNKHKTLTPPKEHRKAEEPKNIEDVDNKIASNVDPHVNNNTNTDSHPIVRKVEEQLSRKMLSEISTVSASFKKGQAFDDVDLEIQKQLEKEINNSTFWHLPKGNDNIDANFQIVSNQLVLVNQDGKIIWSDLNYKEKYKTDPNYVKLIIKHLTSNQQNN